MANSKNAKKEFDKQYIYNLIMPSGGDEDESPPEEPRGAPAASPLQQPEEEASYQDSLSALKSKLHEKPAVGVQLRPARELVLVNLMESLVVERLDPAFDKFNCCKCDKCRKDVVAVALNSLPAKYVVAEPDQIPALLAQCPTKDVSSAIIKAIIQIKSNPHH